MGVSGLSIDPVYVALALVTLVISAAAQLHIRSTFARWDAVPNSVGLSGLQVGQRLISTAHFGNHAGAGATGISFNIVPGPLSDRFDPRMRQVGLSAAVARTPSVAAMAVVAHEVGHAQQHAEGTVAMQLRTFLVPAVTISPSLSYICILSGLVFDVAGLVYVGIVFFALMVLFALLTLPVEIDASRRGLAMLRQSGLAVTAGEANGARSVLTAAALTYVAAAVTSVLTLLYYLSVAQRRS